jgi:hypothetical protein
MNRSNKGAEQCLELAVGKIESAVRRRNVPHFLVVDSTAGMSREPCAEVKFKEAMIKR